MADGPKPGGKGTAAGREAVGKGGRESSDGAAHSSPVRKRSGIQQPMAGITLLDCGGIGGCCFRAIATAGMLQAGK